MNTLLHLSFCAILICQSGPAQTAPAQGGLSDEGKQAASSLATAGWSGQLVSQDLNFSVRLVAICTPAMRNALAHLKDLPAQQRKAFSEWARIEFRRRGWFFKAKVAKGKYQIGLSLVHGQPMLTLRQGSKKFAEVPFWFEGEIKAKAAAELQQSAGASRLTIRFDNIKLTYRFVSNVAHEALIKSLEVHGKGRVRIRSDLSCKPQLRELASWLEKAMRGSETFHGGKPGSESYELCLLAARKGYLDLDRLLTGGNFARNGAFTSDLTHISYVWYHPYAEPEAFVDHGIPLRLKKLCLHELQHVWGYKNRPSLLEANPRWFDEALAERGVKAGLASVDQKLAKGMHQRHLDRLAFARADMRVPTYQDVLNWQAGNRLSENYSAAYLFSYRGLGKKNKNLPDLLTRISASGFPHQGLFVLRDAGFDARAYAKILVAGKPKLPLRILGDYDRVGKSLRLISSKERDARILLPQLAKAGKLQFKGSLSWHPLGSQQADLYLGYRRGLRSKEFIKLALLPKRVVLFWYRSGLWIRGLTKDYVKALEVGSAKERSWHSFTVELDAKARTLDLSLGKDRKARFTLPGRLDLNGTRVGLGVYDGIAWFKELRVR